MSKEIGRIGQRRYGGVIYEEFLPELRGSRGVVGVLAIGGTFFILLIREFGKFIDEVSPYNWGESEVLKDEYKR